MSKQIEFSKSDLTSICNALQYVEEHLVHNSERVFQIKASAGKLRQRILAHERELATEETGPRPFTEKQMITWLKRIEKAFYYEEDPDLYPHLCEQASLVTTDKDWETIFALTLKLAGENRNNP